MSWEHEIILQLVKRIEALESQVAALEQSNGELYEIVYDLTNEENEI